MYRPSSAGRTVVLALAMALAIAAVPAALARQDVPPQAIEVGAGPIGEPSLRFVGRALYEPGRLVLIGYLTAATNLGPEVIFAQSPPDAESARLTFSAEIETENPTTRGDVRSVSGDGELRIFLDDGGADWADPASFSDGEELAAYSLALRETLQRQDPAIGVVVGDGQLTQELAGEFSLGDADLRFGRSGIASRLRYTGALIGTEAGTPGAAASVLGTVTVTAREARPVPLGASAEPAS